MEKTFIFDYDDLLAPNEFTYSLAQLEFARWILDEFEMKAPDIPTLMNLHVNIDKKFVETMGFSRERFPTSFKETYRTICNSRDIKPSEEGLNYAYQFGMLAFDESLWKEKGLVKGAKETIEFLVEQKDELLLLTKGDLRVQERKIEITGVKKWFGENIYIVSKKDEKILLNCVGERNKERVWHIGNSIRSDVEPALKAGIRMIYIPCETWAYEMEHKGVPENKNLLTFSKILEIKEKYSLIE